MGIINSALTAGKVKLLKRKQYNSLKLRKFFSENYRIDVGLYSYGCFDRWRMPGPLRVARFCSIASTVRVIPQNHSIHALTTHPVLYDPSLGVVGMETTEPRELVIEDDVWIGHNAIILPRCKHIGRGAIIGAGSIVTRDVAAYSIVAGNPATLIKARFPLEMIKAIEKTEWWTLDLAELRGLFDSNPDLCLHPTTAALLEWQSTKLIGDRTR